MGTSFNHYLPVYKNLESEVLKLSRYVQINDQQLCVYSTYIADLIVRCAMEIEAISKELYWKYGGEKKYDKNGMERELFFDTDCIEYLNNIWCICKKEVVISSEQFYFEDDANRVFSPLNKGNARSGAKWNKAYQAVKHDRKKSIMQGNIKNLLHALGALYILNIYYSDKTVDLGASFIPTEEFDARMGSQIFSASFIDATKVPIGEAPETDKVFDELREKGKKAIYIVKYKDESWNGMNNALNNANEKMRQAMIDSGKLESYYNEHPEDFKGETQKHITYIVSKVLGDDFIRNTNVYADFCRELNNGKVEAIVNKNQPIY